MHIKFTLSQKKKKLFFSVLIKKKKNWSWYIAIELYIYFSFWLFQYFWRNKFVYLIANPN